MAVSTLVPVGIVISLVPSHRDGPSLNDSPSRAPAIRPISGFTSARSTASCNVAGPRVTQSGSDEVGCSAESSICMVTGPRAPRSLERAKVMASLPLTDNSARCGP